MLPKAGEIKREEMEEKGEERKREVILLKDICRGSFECPPTPQTVSSLLCSLNIENYCKFLCPQPHPQPLPFDAPGLPAAQQ